MEASFFVYMCPLNDTANVAILDFADLTGVDAI